MGPPRKIWIGISGWRYRGWRGSFYPARLRQSDELKFASQKINSIEINGSFYSLQTPQSYRTWHDSTPRDFRFSLKGSRFVTHLKQLNDVRIPLANFFSSGILNLREKLGPFLWQLPPRMKFNASKVESFLKLLPHSTDALSKLARQHDSRTSHRSRLSPFAPLRIRHAIEIRNESFLNSVFLDLLKKYDICLAISDGGDRWPCVEQLTSDFVYVRLHGSEHLYASNYDERALALWAAKIKRWSKARPVFVYFDNDQKVYAPKNAIELAQKLRASARRPW